MRRYRRFLVYCSISIVFPAFNEEGNIEQAIKMAHEVMSNYAKPVTWVCAIRMMRKGQNEDELIC